MESIRAMPDASAPPVVVIACRVFEALLEPRKINDKEWQVMFLDYGLHAVPRKLTQAVQAGVDAIDTPSLIVLGYGLCGNGLNGVKAGKHTLLISRADDCIAMLLGSYEAYRREFDSAPGTYYLTRGWLEAGSDPLSQYEKYLQKYDRDTAQYLIDTQYRHYKRLALVAHSADELERCRPRALNIAEFCRQWGMEYVEILGSNTYVNRLIEVADMLDHAGDDFLIIPPGGEIQQGMFVRDES